MHIKIDRTTPLIGAIAFGIIDRGTNLIQVRFTSLCNLNCTFCSVDSGNNSKWHPNTFEVDLDYLVEEIEKVLKFKGKEIEINLDSVGECFTYPKIEELTKRIRNISNVKEISIQTNGTIYKDIDVDRINLSIHSLDDKKSKELAGTPNYSIEKVKEFAQKYKEKGTKIRICPVWIPKVNDNDIPEIIEYSKENNFDLGIQKYENYKYSRKIPKVKPLNWWKFYRQIEIWEKEHNIKLKLSAKDLNIEKAPRIPEMFKKGEKTQATIIQYGWLNDQMIATAKNRCISINNCKKKIGDRLNIKILETKNNLYLAE